MPNNIEICNIILSSLITAHEYKTINLDVVLNKGMNKNWFITPAQKLIFEVISLSYSADIVFTESKIIKYLQKNNIDSPDMIILDLLSYKQLPQNVILQYIEELREDYEKRVISEVLEKAQAMLNSNENTAAIKQLFQNTVDDIDNAEDGEIRALSVIRKERKSKPPVKRLPLGIRFIDTVLTDKKGNVGLRNEGLFFISGLKQSGKTFIVKRMVENVSIENKVVFGTLEFGEELYDEDIEEAEELGEFDGNIDNIYVYDKIYDTDKMIAKLKLHKKRHGCALIVIDSMLRMTNNQPNLKTDERRISDMFSKLGKLSKEIKTPIAIIVQSAKEDLKSSVISVKGSMNADHESYIWMHIVKTDPKNPEDERRTVIWNKNKDTHKHPKQYLMFVPQTKDFYQYTIDDQGKPSKALHDYRKPKVEVIHITPEEALQKNSSKKLKKSDSTIEMPQIEF